LEACSDDENSGGNNNNPSLADISGVWDATNTIGQEIDEIYVVIRANGESITYDYNGDSFDQGSNCYISYSETLTDLGGGEFEITDVFDEKYIATFELSGNQLIAETTFRSTTITQTLSPTSLQESDFSPPC
jgi:hypothetical protein